MEWPEILLLAVAAVILLLLMKFGKKRGENTRSAQMMKRYETLDETTFDRIPEGEVTDAVVCRLLSQAEKTPRPDPVKELGNMQHGFTVAYSVWVICKEMASSDFPALMSTSSREMVDLAVDGFAAIGATACSEKLKDLKEAYDRLAEETVVVEEQFKTAEASFREAVFNEQPLGLCDDYIRDHREEFIDGENDEPLPEALPDTPDSEE